MHFDLKTGKNTKISYTESKATNCLLAFYQQNLVYNCHIILTFEA